MAWAAWGLCASLALASGAALAHGEADDALPPEPGMRLSAAAAVTWLDANKELPSQRLRGFLLQGDSGTDRQGLNLEHATLGAAWRLNDILGAELTVGKHGSDRAHVESAWVQARHDADGADHWWLLTAGRQRPALGGTLGQGGHFDRFALMPLAKQMATHGDWMDDGLQLGWRQDTGQRRLSADVGLWAGRVFPGGVSPAAGAPFGGSAFGACGAGPSPAGRSTRGGFGRGGCAWMRASALSMSPDSSSSVASSVFSIVRAMASRWSGEGFFST